MAQCSGTKRDGSPCRAKPRKNRPYCVTHDDSPDSKETLALARRRGGLASTWYSNPSLMFDGEIRSPRNVIEYLDHLRKQVQSGAIPGQAALAQCAIAAQITAALKVQLEQDLAAKEKTPQNIVLRWGHEVGLSEAELAEQQRQASEITKAQEDRNGKPDVER